MGFEVRVAVKENGRGGSKKWSLDADKQGEWTLADLLYFCKKSLLTISADALREEQAKGFDKNPITLVDKKPNRDVASVHPLGQIQFLAHQNISEILMHSYMAIWSRSPNKTGNYLSNNVVFYNGKIVATNPSELKQWLDKGVAFGDKDKVRFVNMAPYARKLELMGVTASGTSTKWGKGDKKRKRSGIHQIRNAQGQVRKPNGAYTLAKKAIDAKWGKAVFVKYELMRGDFLNLTGPGRVRKTSSPKGTPYVYPTILIYLYDASGPTH